MDKALLEQQLAELPLYAYFYIDPKNLDFSERIRYICQHECPMYGKSWACPPGVGEVFQCEKKCKSYENCLLIGTITEVDDVADIDACLETRGHTRK
jgi:predicted metal-binding protein